MDKSDPYRYENLTQEQIQALRQYSESMNLQPIFLNPDSFNRVPLAKRKRLFDNISGFVSATENKRNEYTLPSDFGLTNMQAPASKPAPAAAPATAAPAPRTTAQGPAAKFQQGASLFAQTGGDEDPPGFRPAGSSPLSTVLFPQDAVGDEELPPGFIPLSAPAGNRAKEVGIGLLEGGVRYGAPAVAAAAAYNAAMTPSLLAIPATGGWSLAYPFLAGLGAYGATAFMADVAADKAFPAPARPDLVPFREGALTAGGIIAGSPSALLIKAPGAVNISGPLGRRIYNLVDSMTTQAQRNPKLYLGSEALTATAAGLAGGAAVAYDPDSPWTRFGAEFGASVFTPGRLLYSGIAAGYDATKNILARGKGGEGVDTARANALYKILDGALSQAGPIKTLEELGTPEALSQAQVLRDRYYKTLIRQLEQNFPEGVKPTAAQATGDPLFGVLERSLAVGDPSFGSKIKDQGAAALRAHMAIIESLREIGDPASLAAAAKMQAELYDSMVLGRIGIAERNAAQAVANITRDSPAARVQIGETIKENVEEALQEARDYEKGLWQKAFRESLRTVKGKLVPRVITPRQTLIAYIDAISDMAPELQQTLPKELRQMMTRLGVTEEAVASYRRGKLTPEYMKTGKVPDEYLISGILPGKRVFVDNPKGSATRWDSAKRKQVRGDWEDGSPTAIPLGAGTVRISGEKLGPMFQVGAVVPNTVSVEDLIQARSALLTWARDAAGGTGGFSPVHSRLLGRVAESVLDDFQQLPGAAYDKARSFSRALNDNFTRSYARNITAVNRLGSERLPAELIVQNAFRGDSDLVGMRLDEMEDAVGFFKKRYDALGEQLELLRSQRATPSQLRVVQSEMEELAPLADVAAQRLGTIANSSEKVLRMMASNPNIVHPVTGRVNERAMRSWMTKYSTVLDRFPALRRDLQSAADAEAALAAIDAPGSAIGRELRDQQAFSRVLAGGEKPVHAVTSVLGGKNPYKGFMQLVQVARQAAPDSMQAPTRDAMRLMSNSPAVRGLKSSVFEWAYTQAGGTGNVFNIQKFDDLLFKPVSPGNPSVVAMMTEQGLMTTQEVKNLRKLIAPIVRIEQSKENRAFLDSLVAGGDPLQAFAVRWAALHLGSDVIPTGPGSLAAASALSNYAKEIFANMPRLNALAALREAAADPQLMAQLLRRGRTTEEKVSILRQTGRMLADKGFVAPAFMVQRTVVPAGNVLRQEDVRRRTEEAERNTFGPNGLPPTFGLPGQQDFPKLNRRPPPPAPPTRGVPRTGAQGKPPQGAPAPGGAPPTSQSRGMLQQLFPFDSITGMAAPPPMQG